MGFVTLTDGMRASSNQTHDTGVFIEILRGYYVSDLTDEENEQLKRFAVMLHEIRDGTANIAKAYTRLGEVDR